MSFDKSTLRTRLTRAAAAIVSVGLLSPLALLTPASADTLNPGTVTTATVLDAALNPVAGQTNVAPNGPLTGLVNGSTVRMTVNAGPGNSGLFFGADARLCRDVNITSPAAFTPSNLGNCISVPFNAASDDFTTASASPTNNTVTFDFRVGTGSQVVTYASGTRTITCDAANTCDLWLREYVDTSIQPSGNSFIHYDLLYAGTPGQATAVNATAGNQTATVNWTAPVNTGNAALYQYDVALTGGPCTQCSFTVPAATTSQAFAGLTNFTNYTATVIARNRAADGVTTFDSAPTAGVNVTPAPAGPTNVSGVPGNGSVALTWTAPAGTPPNFYEITATPTNPAGADIVQTGTAAASHNFTGLTNGTVYTFKVRAAYNPGPTFGAFSASSAPITPNSRLITQTITVRRPQGNLVLTQVCGARGAINTGTAPSFGAGTDPLFGQYPYPVDGNGDSIANYPTDCAINLGNATLLTTGTTAGQFFRATGNIHQVTVVDTRDTDAGWEASGQMGDFVSGVNTFSGSQLGWDPIMTDDSDSFVSPSGPYDQVVTEGAVIAPSTVGGLGISKRLAIAAPNAGLGIARLDADLDLYIPVFANAGTYTGILTITAV